MFVAWPKIENFYTVRRNLHAVPLEGDPKVVYKAKTKLHGSNGGIVLYEDGQVMALSRVKTITPGKDDNAGFARFVSEGTWTNLCKWGRRLVIFGEWCGPGIQKGMAINQLPDRVFAIFAILNVTPGHEDELIVEPAEIFAIVGEMPRTYVIPWHSSEKSTDEAVNAWHDEPVVEGVSSPNLYEAMGMTYEEYLLWVANPKNHPGHRYGIDWSKTSEELTPMIDKINGHVLEVEACDPWAKETFGVEGLGEGLVLFPISHPGLAAFQRLAFKAKGEKHATVAHTKPVQADPTVVWGAEAFAEMVITPARLEQGARAVAEGELTFDVKNLGLFLRWIGEDVTKETKAELVASGLTLKVALAACTFRAKLWYLAQIKV